MNKIVTAALTPTRAMQGFRTTVAHYHKATLVLLASATVVLLVSQHAKKPADYDNTITKIKGEVATQAEIANSQVYKIVGLARKFAERISDDKKAVVLNKLLKAKTHDAALDVVMGYFETQKVVSIEAATVVTGLYQRTPPAPRHTGRQAPPGGLTTQALQPAAATATTAPPVVKREVQVPRGKRAMKTEAEKATGKKMTTAEITAYWDDKAKQNEAPPAPVAAITDGLTTTLQTMPPSLIAQSLLRSGHKASDLIDALVPALDALQSQQIMQRITAHLATLATNNGVAREKVEQARRGVIAA